jgi:hypothetical protein
MMETLNKHEILMIRACKIQGLERSIFRLKKIMRAVYLDDSSDVMLHWLFELAIKIHPGDMLWAFHLGKKEMYYPEGETFNEIALRQIISKIKLSRVDELPGGFIPPLRFRRKIK